MLLFVIFARALNIFLDIDNTRDLAKFFLGEIEIVIKLLAYEKFD